MVRGISVLMVCVCLLGCQGKVYTVTKLEADKVFDRFSDSTFIHRISDIKCYGGDVYICDATNGRVLKTDENLVISKSIGHPGKGPGEFLELKCADLIKDTMYVLDVVGVRVDKFDTDGGYIGSFALPHFSFTMNSFATNREDALYFTAFGYKAPITKFDTHLNEVFACGKYIDGGTEKETRAINSRAIICLDSLVITLLSDNPRVEVYTENGQFIKEYDLPVELFESRLAFKRNEQAGDPKKKATTYKIFTVVSCVGDKVYALYVDHEPQTDIAQCNKVVEFVLERPSCELKINHVYELSEGTWYQSMGVSEDGRLIAFDYPSQEMHVYKLGV